QTRDYVFVDDIAEASVRALARGDGEVLNLGSGVETSTAELAELTVQVAGVPALTERRPERPGDVARACLSPEKAERVLGWKPTHDLRAGLTKTIRWYRQGQAAGQPIG
ncbi:MAG TPA: GDP-mannose 4,6-dehydratase, partial [Fimbriimonadaceae bacterium]|nr:GDP-mannose 4,6-dehydratase [Fimbriimonadaceae bacterium]